MPKSQLLNSIELTTDRWVISIANTGSVFAGHSAIIVEGIKQKEDKIVGGRELFYGFYDIRAALWPGEEKKSSVGQTGYVYQVTVKEGNSYPEGIDFSRYYAKSWPVTPDRVNKMLRAIYAARDQILAIDEDYGPGGHPDKRRYPAWSVVGMDTVFGDMHRGMNCTNYCADWLKEADIGNGSGKKPSSPILCCVL